MAGESAVGDYTDVVLFLATAGVVVPIFRRFRLSPVLAQQAGRLYQLGASDVVPETIEASLRLSEALLSRIGMPPDAVFASIRQRRDEFRHQAGNTETANRQGRRSPRR